MVVVSLNHKGPATMIPASLNSWTLWEQTFVVFLGIISALLTMHQHGLAILKWILGWLVTEKTETVRRSVHHRSGYSRKEWWKVYEQVLGR